MNGDGTNQRRLTNNGAADSHPTWSRGGGRIAFVSERDGNREIYAMDYVDSDGDGNGDNLVNLTNNPAADFDPDWHP